MALSLYFIKLQQINFKLKINKLFFELEKKRQDNREGFLFKRNFLVVPSDE